MAKVEFDFRLNIFHCRYLALRNALIFLPYSRDGVTLPQTIINDGNDRHSTQACRVHAAPGLRMFQ
jgi:hypothetical protein